MRSGGEVGIALDPREAIQVQRRIASTFTRLFALEANLTIHIHPVLSRSSFDEWEIEIITVVRDVNARLRLAHMIKPRADERLLVRHVPNDERAFVLGLWRVLEIFYVLAHDFTVDYQIPLAVQHVRNHKHLVVLGVRKL